MSSSSSAQSAWRSPLVVIIAGCLIAVVGFGTRSSFGFYLEPITTARGFSRETFALALAIQNLMWGIGVPIAGLISDRFGAARVILLGTIVYGIGIYGMTLAETGSMLYLTAGVLTGVGVAFTAFSLALAAMVKVVSPQKRSLVLGLGTAAGSFGQVIFSPLSHGLIEAFGWDSALLMQAAITLIMVPLAFMLPGSGQSALQPEAQVRLSRVLAVASRHRGYILLTTGFFVCGFHVAFIAVHFPAYIKDLGLDPKIAAYALALVGLFNIFGSLSAGYIGQHYSMKSSLSLIYLARAVTILGLLLLPKTAMNIYLFASVMGLLWLSTVPLTTAIVAQIFGVRYLATLFGIVFFSHQLGSFMGVWLGGRLHDTFGSYDAMWWAAIFFGVLAAIVHWPINEKALPEFQPQPA